MNKQLYQIEFPEADASLEQDEEWFYLQTDGGQRRIRFHDYDQIYDIPGLYEQLFHGRLKCQSPEVLTSMLAETLIKHQARPYELRILDFGAGNGLVGKALKERLNPELLVGVDILPEAKAAQMRERPEVYHDYQVCNLASPSMELERLLQDYKFNALVTVAALGFDDIPPEALINAFNLVSDGGWFAFNIRDKFLQTDDNSGYREAISWLSDEAFEVYHQHRYVHRYDMLGKPLHYIAFVGRKNSNIKVQRL
ncbi:class I SAM-dependent DNA methyltransferase [Eisenibacter elegans]|uniref:class I SAM-dependent DNA methyltransferase n=1 Tax=Eisenibacter elegans TaxID=997 RepID=UPI00040996D7|nr:class I SAM-dependent methyltransferase [Eisenibacter elegans]